MKLGIIGCGTIAATYIPALSQLGDLFQITALCDLDLQKARSLGLPGVKLCTGVEELITGDTVQCVIISTPLHTHLAVARACLAAGKHVLLEKPAVLDTAALQSLFTLAEEAGVTFQVAFHASFGLDIQWYLAHLAHSDSPYRLENIRSLTCRFFDPYMPQGTVLEDRKGLGGSYIDSGVNALSVCARLTTLTGLRVSTHTVKQTADGVVYASETSFRSETAAITVSTGWDRGLNHKSTTLCFAGTDTALLLDHTAQAVYLAPPEGPRQLLYREDASPRMVNQYVGVFRSFAEGIGSGPSPAHRSDASAIHRALLSVHPI